MSPASLSSLMVATRGRLVGSAVESATFARVEIDSRRIGPGDLFWALPGEHHDGHDFLADAQRLGAVAAVVQADRLPRLTDVSLSLIVVEETLAALADFARWHRSQHTGLVIGVTGSFGKTTTREMIHAVLSSTKSGVRSLKNFNNHIGLPLSLLELDHDHEFAVLEMGASAVGEIALLTEIAKPEIGVITGIGLAHVEGFGSPERIQLGKGELLEALPSTGFAILPGDDPTTRNMAARTSSPSLFVGEGDGNHVQARNVRVANHRLIFEVDRFEYSVPVTGRHFLRASLTALAIARELGLSPSQIAEGFANFQAAPGRCEVLTIGPWTVIDDSYNANPASMQAACETLRDWAGANKRLLIIGDMLELGPHAEQAHVELGRVAATSQFDGLFVVGQQAEHVVRGALNAGMQRGRVTLCDSMDTLQTLLVNTLEPNDVLLIKGSRGMRMERVLVWLRETNAKREARSAEPATNSTLDVVHSALPTPHSQL